MLKITEIRVIHSLVTSGIWVWNCLWPGKMEHKNKFYHLIRLQTASLFVGKLCISGNYANGSLPGGRAHLLQSSRSNSLRRLLAIDSFSDIRKIVCEMPHQARLEGWTERHFRGSLPWPESFQLLELSFHCSTLCAMLTVVLLCITQPWSCLYMDLPSLMAKTLRPGSRMQP